jgi:hypothetical protein
MSNYYAYVQVYKNGEPLTNSGIVQLISVQTPQYENNQPLILDIQSQQTHALQSGLQSDATYYSGYGNRIKSTIHLGAPKNTQTA